MEEMDEITSPSLRARLGIEEGEITGEDLALASKAVAMRDDD